MIDTIIDLINNGFDGLNESEIILGLAQRVYRQTSDGVEYMPGIVKSDGEIVYAGIDDINSLLIYHKINSSNLSFTPKGGYGDTRESEDSLQCNCIAAWDSRKINLHHADMLLLLRSRVPQEIKGIENIKRIIIVPSSALLNTKAIFESEYAFDENYLLPNYINFVQLNYTIVIRYDQQCINKCINC